MKIITCFCKKQSLQTDMVYTLTHSSSHIGNPADLVNENGVEEFYLGKVPKRVWGRAIKSGKVGAQQTFFMDGVESKFWSGKCSCCFHHKM